MRPFSALLPIAALLVLDTGHALPANNKQTWPPPYQEKRQLRVEESGLVKVAEMMDNVLSTTFAKKLRLNEEHGTFYKRLMHDISDREKKFKIWASNGYGKEQVVRFMTLHGRSKKEIEYILKLYLSFLNTEKVL
ncbi:hypothetical protein PsorP6_016606 [Peronosclerospora sorghi]|uniref:Uncharacterized protein n=1 Tax=Peronosclerospora sorghi TaxID=230839 RepID=A0ACC0VNH4_9STRA|nr:hypothetical protein PsorP6_016606 [Peronosclerospora sorghi]